MPIYTYRCRECGHEFEELLLSLRAEKDLRCPQCRTTSIERRLAPFATVSSRANAAPSCSQGSCSTCPYDI